MTRRMTTTVILVLMPLALLALVWALQRRLIYFPFGGVPQPEALGLQHVEAVAFPTGDGLTLHGWFFPGAKPRGFTLLVCNGNAGNRAYRTPLAVALQARGIGVLLFDYRGYGGNPGSPSEAGLAADSRAARDYLLGRRDVERSRLVYYGESLGAAVATELASAHPPAALILRSPFTSMVDVGRVHYPILPVHWLLRDRYPSIDRIGRIRAPLLVVGGDRDGIVPIEQSRRLYEAAGSSVRKLIVIPGADHNDEALLSGEQLIRAVVDLLQDLDGT
jgi:fermentation-respiration switch protein FrsA (DUF1100 family)